MIKPLTAWSFSRYRDYTTCPKKLFYSAIKRLKEPEAKPDDPESAMQRGSRIHTLAEQYLKGEASRLPKELSKLGAEYKALRALVRNSNVETWIEETWYFKKDWTFTVWNDWDNIWLRVKIDVAFLDGTKGGVIDNKTGKFSNYKLDEYILQTELYATGALLAFQKVKNLEVYPRLYYVDEGFVYPKDVTPFVKDDLEMLQVKWEDRVGPMLRDTEFKAKPGKHCTWCPWGKSKGIGDCEHG